jgi:hypothetical protein
MNVAFAELRALYTSLNTMSSQKRKYELKARAQSQERTRRKIAAAAAELHEEVGIGTRRWPTSPAARACSG